ncbi:MAG: hypothetical protein R2853_05600 [Thermomicrobiales bacterium]
MSGDDRDAFVEFLAEPGAAESPELEFKEAGGGIPRIYRAWREPGYEPPEIEPQAERHEFRITLPYEHLLSAEDRTWLARFNADFNETEQLALIIARQDEGVDNQAVRAVTGAHGADVSRVLTGLRDRGFLVMVGNKRGARYFLKPVNLVDNGSDLVDSGTSLGDSGSSSGDFDPSIVDSGSSLVDFNPKSGDFGSSSGDFDPSSGDKKPSPLPWRPLSQTAAFALKARQEKPPLVDAIVQLCTMEQLTTQQLAELLGRDQVHIRKTVSTLVQRGVLQPTYAQRNHPRQAYTAKV